MTDIDIWRTYDENRVALVHKGYDGGIIWKRMADKHGLTQKQMWDEVNRIRAERRAGTSPTLVAGNKKLRKQARSKKKRSD